MNSLYRIIFPVLAGMLGTAFSVTAVASPTSWQPFHLQANTSFFYEVIDHTKHVKGEFNLEIQEQVGGRLKALWKSRAGKDAEYHAYTIESPERLVERSRPVMIRWPLAAPIISTILSQWWEGFAGFDWKIGAVTTVGPQDVAPIVAKVTEPCVWEGHKGLKASLSYGNQSVGELCVATKLALPLWAKTYDTKGHLRQEGRLLKYQSPKTSATSHPLSKMSVPEARKQVPFEIFKPTYLPPETKLVETRVFEEQGQAYVTLHYEFAGEKRFFQIDEYLPDIKEPEWAEQQRKMVNMGPVSGEMLTMSDGVNALRWTLKKTRIVINGELNSEEMIKIAESIK